MGHYALANTRRAICDYTYGAGTYAREAYNQDPADCETNTGAAGAHVRQHASAAGGHVQQTCSSGWNHHPADTAGNCSAGLAHLRTMGRHTRLRDDSMRTTGCWPSRGCWPTSWPTRASMRRGSKPAVSGTPILDTPYVQDSSVAATGLQLPLHAIHEGGADERPPQSSDLMDIDADGSQASTQDTLSPSHAAGASRAASPVQSPRTERHTCDV